MQKFTMHLILGFATLISTFSYAANNQSQFNVKGEVVKPKSVTGSGKTYTLNGIRYTTKSKSAAKTYAKQGVASYYHKKFHGRLTANGEVFNTYHFTAAHKTLPFNSYVLVTNLRTNKKVIVRINDRGPFSGKRIIDLSYAAAKEIGMLKSGVAQVKVEALYVDNKGQLAGPGLRTLQGQSFQIAQAKSQPKKQPNTPIVQTANAKTVLNNEPEEPIESFLLKVIHLNKKQMEKLVEQLSTNIQHKIIQHTNKYDVQLGPVKSQQEVNDLKMAIRKIDQRYAVMIYPELKQSE